MQKEIDCADLRELLWRGGGTLLESSNEGTIVRGDKDGTIITDYMDGEKLCRKLEKLEQDNLDQFSVKSMEVAQTLAGRYGLQVKDPCSQWVYCKKTPPKTGEYDIHRVKPEEAPEAAKYYHLMDDSLGYLQDRIAARRLWGIYENGALAGFAGLHTEGSMGLLEVLPQYRRKGYGYALEAYLIAWHLRHGYLPFGQVYEGNESSERLQMKLGMTKAALPAIWVY